MAAALQSEARVATALAQRHMTQLRKHFEHRLAVSCSTAESRALRLPRHA